MIYHFPVILELKEKRYNELRKQREKYLFDHYSDVEERLKQRRQILDLYYRITDSVRENYMNGFVLIDIDDEEFHQSIWNLLFADLESEGYKYQHLPAGLYISW